MPRGENEESKSFKRVREVHSHEGGELRLKSRVLWLREGDKCTKFFHKVANSNRRKNSIDSLLIDGIFSSSRVEISEHIV